MGQTKMVTSKWLFWLVETD